MGVNLPVSDWSANPDACYTSQRYPYVFADGPIRNFYYDISFIKFERRVSLTGRAWRMYVVLYDID